MTGYKYLITIANRKFAEEYLEFFKDYNINHVLEKFCNGTATNTTLDFLGLKDNHNVMFETLITNEKTKELIKGLRNEMNIEGAGNGIALFISVDGIGGKSSKEYFIDEKNSESKENTNMESYNSVLIITIVDKGNTELVMDSAKAAGATGGTVVRAHGTGTDIAKFFCITISEEKEMVYIVSSRANRDNIMKAIMEKAGRGTAAHGVVFSLPIDKVIGMSIE